MPPSHHWLGGISCGHLPACRARIAGSICEFLLWDGTTMSVINPFEESLGVPKGPGPTATGFEQLAAMCRGSAMLRKAAKANDVAKGGIRAMTRGKILGYDGRYTKCMNLLGKVVPRSAVRTYAETMNR